MGIGRKPALAVMAAGTGSRYGGFMWVIFLICREK